MAKKRKAEVEVTVAQTPNGGPRVRINFDSTEEVREAVQQIARRLSAERRRDVSQSDVLNEILRPLLQPEIEEVRRAKKEKS